MSTHHPSTPKMATNRKVTMSMMISSMGSNYVVRDASVTMTRVHNNKASGRSPHRLRLDPERVSYSFCCLYSIPEEEEVCRYRQMVRDEPSVVVVKHPVPTTTTEVLLPNNTAAAVVNSDSTLSNESMELPTEATSNNNDSDKDDTELPPVPCPVEKKRFRHAWKASGFLQTLREMAMLQ